jgi:hypothetical protein
MENVQSASFETEHPQKSLGIVWEKYLWAFGLSIISSLLLNAMREKGCGRLDV